MTYALTQTPTIHGELQNSKPTIMDRITTLRYVLSSAEELPWDHALYLPENQPPSLETPAIVWDVNDVERDDVDEPEFAIENGMKYVLGINDIQDIVSNCGQQVESPSIELLFEAFLHYLKHDGFIVLD